MGQNLSRRACTEGQGWAMMLAVQMDDRAMFDKLWKFTKRNMQIRSFQPNSKRGYYFAWQV
ncbi:glycosyl hydrolase family 8, partial [Acinetobacter baumannii]